jgi:hypothetical protein
MLQKIFQKMVDFQTPLHYAYRMKIKVYFCRRTGMIRIQWRFQ